MNKGIFTVLAAVAAFANATTASAQVINFETIPGGSPVDGMTIDSQFESDFGVTFSLEGGGAPVLAKVGAPRTAFQGYNLLPDQPAPGVNAGEYFLTDDGVVSGPPTPLIIRYSTPVSGAGGSILDIDGAEEFTVQARDAGDNVIATRVLPPNNVLDGSATPWQFDLGSDVIHSIRIVFTGSGGGVGLAFDNFSTSAPIPEPASILGVATGLAIALRRRKKR